MRADLELPPGFALARGLFSSTRLDDVIHDIRWEQQSIRIYGREVPQPRMTSWMGTGAYTYSGRRHEPAPMPPVVGDILARLECRGAFVGAGDNVARFNSVLGNLYRHGGDSVSWHADDERELGQEPLIASLSLGAARRFSIRHNATKRRWDVTLQHGDLLVMGGRSQLDYQHCLPKTATRVLPRVNLTFRTILA